MLPVGLFRFKFRVAAEFFGMILKQVLPAIRIFSTRRGGVGVWQKFRNKEVICRSFLCRFL
jgi:hypothetical protein